MNELVTSGLMTERLHRLSLDVVKMLLEKIGVWDINPTQILMLYNIGTKRLTVGNLKTQGYYLGSNVSYNLGKMIENGYLSQVPSSHDKRSSYIQLTQKGIFLRENITALGSEHEKELLNVILSKDKLKEFYETLKLLEGFWGSLLNK